MPTVLGPRENFRELGRECSRDFIAALPSQDRQAASWKQNGKQLQLSEPWGWGDCHPSSRSRQEGMASSAAGQLQVRQQAALPEKGRSLEAQVQYGGRADKQARAPVSEAQPFTGAGLKDPEQTAGAPNPVGTCPPPCPPPAPSRGRGAGELPWWDRAGRGGVGRAPSRLGELLDPGWGLSAVAGCTRGGLTGQSEVGPPSGKPSLQHSGPCSVCPAHKEGLQGPH